jgi:hypothetical protein
MSEKISARTRLHRLREKAFLSILPIVCFCALPTDTCALRIKDMAEFQGVRGNQLIGYGLVVGLKGTGDEAGTSFTLQSLVNMLERMGIFVNKKEVKVKNVAAVMVTAVLPPFAGSGSKLDALVSSIVFDVNYSFPSATIRIPVLLQVFSMCLPLGGGRAGWLIMMFSSSWIVRVGNFADSVPG